MFNIIHFQEISSTNDYLKDNYDSLPDLTVVYADHQTHGKGRLGREWKDDSKSLVYSILLKDNLDKIDTSLLPLLCGASMVEMLKKENIKASIKWPNDIIINDRKCTGILLESVIKEKMLACVCGIGLNLNDDSFPQELKNKAISLHQVTSKLYDKEVVLTNYLKEFELFYFKYLNGDTSFMKVVQENSYLNNKEVYLNYYGEDIHGTVVKILDNGRLLVKDSNSSLLQLNSGEVTLSNSYKG